MERHPVDSSNIKSIGFCPETKRLHVEFGSPSAPPDQCCVFEYHGVSAAEHAALMKAESHGKHFAKHLKPRYKGKKLPG